MTSTIRKFAPLLLILTAGMEPSPAFSGAFRLEPGNQTWVDTDPQGFTTITIRNLGQESGRLAFPGAQFPQLEIRSGEQVELYSRLGRSAISVENQGITPIEVISRYLDRPRFVP